MSDESKVKPTFIRPVNRTMSYEDRKGYVCICMYVYVYVNMYSHMRTKTLITYLSSQDQSLNGIHLPPSIT